MITDNDQSETRKHNLTQQRAHHLRERDYAYERSQFYADLGDTRQKYYWQSLGKRAEFKASQLLHEISTGKKDNRKFEDYE